MSDIKIKRKVKNFKKNNKVLIKTLSRVKQIESNSKESKSNFLKIGHLIAGCIKEISDFEIQIELQKDTHGVLPVTGISQIYTDLLKKSIENEKLVCISKLLKNVYCSLY